MSEEIIARLDKIINLYIMRIGEYRSKNYNRELDSICSDLIDLRNELKQYIIKREE